MSLFRKIIALFLAVILCLSVVACAVTPDTPDTPDNPDNPDNPDQPIVDDDPSYPLDPDSDYLLPNPDLEVKEPTNPFYVYVTSGADATLADGSEAHPYATLEAARDAVRAIDRTGHDSIDIIVSGTFYRNETFYLLEVDSGDENCRIRYIGKDGATITGGVTIPASAFAPVTDSEYLGYFDDAIESNIVTVDLKQFGVTPEDVAYGKWMPYHSSGMSSLFVDGQRLTVARYPDKDFVKIGQVGIVDIDGTTCYQLGYPESCNEEISKWHNYKNIYLYGYFAVYWGANFTKLVDIDTATSTLTAVKDDGYPAQTGMVFCWYNVPEELNTEGEYYITEDAVLYYYPLSDKKDADLYYPIITDRLLYSDASYVTIKGITFEDTQGSAVEISGRNNDFIGNTVRRIGYSAVTMKGFYNRILDCEIANVATTGIILTGGNPEQLILANSVAANNYVHDFSELKATYCGAFYINGCGLTVRNNEACHANHLAIHYSGACNLIEYNEVYDVLNYTDDAGVTYCGRTYACYGNVLRYNYFHDLGTPSLGKNSVCGIYFDDGLGGQIAYGNIVANIYGFGIFAGGGVDCEIYDNIIINSITGLSFDQRYLEQLKAGVLDKNLIDSVSSQIESNTPYIQYFNTLAKMNNNGITSDEWNWAIPSRNIIKNNWSFFATTPLGFGYYGHYYITDAVKQYSNVEGNQDIVYEDGSQPTVEEAIEQSGLDIKLEYIGRIEK